MNDPKELLFLCQNIAGITLKELIQITYGYIPKAITTNKGWIGTLLENYLGATANNLPIPDFPELGIELKSIPIDPKTLHPLGSTYVCTAPLTPLPQHLCWETSVVRSKLSKVLWIPIESSKNLPWEQRRIGKAFIWIPDQAQNLILKNDWEELTEILYLGKIKLLSAKYGKYLQLRPKANNCSENLVNYHTLEEETINTVARGFYLRTNLTKQILLNFFHQHH